MPNTILFENQFGEQTVATVIGGDSPAVAPVANATVLGNFSGAAAPAEALTLAQVILTGLVAGANTPILSTDSLLVALANLQAQVSAGGGGVLGLTTPTLGQFAFDADPDQGEAILYLGTENNDGVIKTPDVAGAGYAGLLLLQGGNSVSGHAGPVVLAGGFQTGTNAQAAILLQGGRVKVSNGLINLEPITSTQRDALSPENGDVIMNSTLGKLQFYFGGGWLTVTST